MILISNSRYSEIINHYAITNRELAFWIFNIGCIRHMTHLEIAKVQLSF